MKKQMEGNRNKKMQQEDTQSFKKLQMKVLVTQRRFDDKQKHFTIAHSRLKGMMGKLSREALAELREIEELESDHLEQEIFSLMCMQKDKIT